MRYLLLGAGFGIVLVKSEVVSWFRIREMFLFESFHMYGVIATAVAVAAISMHLLKRPLPRKTLGKGTRYWMGGTVFGLGWGLSGACPGPMFALLGAGYATAAVLILSALLGAWTYAALRPKLPH